MVVGVTCDGIGNVVRVVVVVLVTLAVQVAV